MDGAASLPDGTGLASGQAINLLTELTVGSHSFSIESVDHVDNHGTTSVAFSIVVTAQSIEDDVAAFLAMHQIKNHGIANSLLAKLEAAAAARARGQCPVAANHYDAFIHELNAQAGKGIDAAAGAIMIEDAQYLNRPLSLSVS